MSLLAGSSTHETESQELERLRQENAALKQKGDRPLSFKIGEKGGLSVYGLSARFPTTLYRSQWERLLGAKEEILAFIDANSDKLKTKE